MSKRLLSLVVFFAALLAAAVAQLAEGLDLDLALMLDFALPLSLVPVLAIYLGARALGFIGGLLLCALVLAELVAPPLAGALVLAVAAYALCYLVWPRFRGRVQRYLADIGLSEPSPHVGP